MTKKQHIPPKLAQRFLLWFLKDDLAEEVQGDLEEKFEWMVEKTTPFKAKLNYWYQVFNYLRPFAIRKTNVLNSIYPTMIRHNFKIGWRILLKNKGYSLINIGGLALGMAVAILISLWIYDELTFNQYHQNYSRIAKIMKSETADGIRWTGASQVTGLGNLLRNSYGDHFEQVVMGTTPRENVIATGEKKFSEFGNYMESGAPELLTLKMLHGSRIGLQDANSILLSESLARKLFGETNPMEKTVRIDAEWPLQVKGVYEDLPKNTEFHRTQYLLPLNFYFSRFKNRAHPNSWTNHNMRIYAQLSANKNFDQVSTIIKDALLPHVDEERAAGNPVVFLHPMSKWHLYSEFDNGVSVMSNPLKFVWFVGIIGLFVMLLACINFVNLSTARAEKRFKEIGVRKTLGSRRNQLIFQFLSESLLIAVLAFILSLSIVQLSLPWLNQIAEKNIEILWTSPWFWSLAISFTICAALLAGSYPAFYLSSFQPISAFKGISRMGYKAAISRKVLVAFQFSISIALIIGTLAIYKQVQFAKKRALGYDQEGVLMIKVTTSEYQSKYDVLRNELLKSGVITEVAASRSPVTDDNARNVGFNWTGKSQNFDPHFNTFFVRPEFGKTIGWEVMQGRDFNKAISGDQSGILLNEVAVHLMGLENPIGQTITWHPEFFEEPKQFTVLGVVKNMIRRSPWQPTPPSIVFLSERHLPWVHIKIHPEISFSEAIPKIEHAFNQAIPTAPFNYQFADETYEAKFKTEERIGVLASFFTVLTILISCLGLFGLASYIAERRTKEIGIRKILGATVVNIWKMLSKDFVQLIIVSNFIAIPISYYFLWQWLQNYEYRTELSWWIFIVAGIGALIVALISVSLQTIKAATTNPVNALRSE